MQTPHVAIVQNQYPSSHRLHAISDTKLCFNDEVRVMQITDFLQKHLSPKAVILLAYESDMTAHFEAYLQQIWPQGRILIVTEPFYREYAERTLLPALNASGFETEYCLCIQSTGTTYRAQIDESLGDGAIDGIVGIAALGSATLFAAARERACALNIACCALLDQFCPRDAFAACDESGNKPCADALFFDLNAIQQKNRDLRDALLELEVGVYALKADMAAAQALGRRIQDGVSDALNEAMPPRLPDLYHPTEDELAQLCEAYCWRAVATRLLARHTSYQTVLDYANASPEYPKFSAAAHAQLMVTIFEAALELESLEISPEDCANRQPPKEILQRTLQQILLEDNVKFEWLKRADENFEDRNALRHTINALVMNWDEFCAKLRPISDVLQAISAQNAAHPEDEIDSTLKTLWMHAARFAPKHTFLKLFNDMSIVEPALYI